MSVVPVRPIEALYARASHITLPSARYDAAAPATLDQHEVGVIGTPGGPHSVPQLPQDSAVLHFVDQDDVGVDRSEDLGHQAQALRQTRGIPATGSWGELLLVDVGVVHQVEQVVDVVAGQGEPRGWLDRGGRHVGVRGVSGSAVSLWREGFHTGDDVQPLSCGLVLTASERQDRPEKQLFVGGTGLEPATRGM